MPHAVIEGPIRAALVHREVGPFEERVAGSVLKVRQSYLSRDERAALLEAVVVEGATRRFFVEVVEHDGGLTLRLFPLTDPEKTDGVKRLLGRITARILALDPQARVARTNLAPWIAEAAP